MPVALENVTVSSNQYTAEATATFQLSTLKVTLIIGTAPVYMQLSRVPVGMRADAGVWQEPEEYVPPGSGDITRPWPIGGVRFRKAVVGSSPDPQVVARGT